MDARWMRSGLMLGALAFAAAACSDDDDPVDPDPDPPALTGTALMQTLEQAQYQENWELWSEDHVLYEVCCGHELEGMADYLTVYLDDAAMEAWENETVFPEGATIVKEAYMAPENDGGEPMLAAMTVMHKAEEGYNPDGNDWFWAMYDGATKEIMDGREGVVSGCIGCHQGRGTNDLVVGPQNTNP